MIIYGVFSSTFIFFPSLGNFCSCHRNLMFQNIFNYTIKKVTAINNHENGLVVRVGGHELVSYLILTVNKL